MSINASGRKVFTNWMMAVKTKCYKQALGLFFICFSLCQTYGHDSKFN